MKKIVTLVFLVYCMTSLLNAQQYNRLIVSGMNHYIIINDHFGVNSMSFPCYFNDSIFLNDIRDTLLTYAKRNYSINSISIPFKLPPSCNELLYYPKIKPAIAGSPSNDCLYITISTTLSFRQYEYEEAFYQLIASVNIINSDRKKVLKSSSAIPFMIRASDGIMTDTLIHKTDFEIFYLEALSAALNGGPKIAEKRFIYQPLSARYDNFLANATSYIIERGDTLYSLVKEDNEAIPLMGIQNQSLAPEEFAALKNEYNGINKFMVTHLNNNDQNVIIMYLNDSAQVNITLSGGMNSGNFSYDDQGIMTGTLNRDTIQLKWNPVSSVSDVFINSELYAVIHYQSGWEYLYLTHEKVPYSLSKIAFLVFLFDEAESLIQGSYTPNW